MDHIQYQGLYQEAKRLHDRIYSFLDDFKVGSLLAGRSIRKFRRAKPLAISTAIFALPHDTPLENRSFKHHKTKRIKAYSKMKLYYYKDLQRKFKDI